VVKAVSRPSHGYKLWLARKKISVSTGNLFIPEEDINTMDRIAWIGQPRIKPERDSTGGGDLVSSQLLPAYM
jgi:hypothetical protein